MAPFPRNGLNRVDVLVIITILLSAICFFLPSVRRVREPAERMSCQNNLKNLMIALESFQSTGRSATILPSNPPGVHTGHLFPPGCLGSGATPEERLSWMVAVLPYLQQDSLYQTFDLEKGYAENFSAGQSRIKELLCPSAKDVETAEALTNYVAMSGIGINAAAQPAGTVGNGFMGYDRLTSLDMIKDGAANTIALMETRHHPGPWARGGSSTLRGFDPTQVSLQGDNPAFGCHPKGINAAMADGSVRFILSTFDPQRLAAAITIAGGEPVDLDWAR